MEAARAGELRVDAGLGSGHGLRPDPQPSVSVEEHVQRVLRGVEPLPPFEQPLLEALGLPVCEQVISPMDLPVFDNSAMDGYAV